MLSESPPRNFAFIAGHRALDLVNTVQWRLSDERFEDDLPAYRHVAAWARQSGLVSAAEAAELDAVAAAEPAAAAAEAGRMRDLRESIHAVLFEGAEPDAVADQYRGAVDAGRLAGSDAGWRWDFPVDLSLPRRRIAVEAVDLLTRADLSLLGQCHDAECGWVYLDTSPRHNRRWCVSADCGNRNRVRDYYERSRAAAR